MKKTITSIVYSVLLVLGSSAFAQDQQLEDYLKQVVDNNPELNAIAMEFEAEQQRVIQSGILPNPQVGIGIPVLQPETRLGPQVLMVSAQQMFPWFGTLKAKETVVLTMANARYERAAALKLELFADFKRAYYQLAFLEEQQKVIQKSLANYTTMEQIALVQVETGKGTLANALRIQMKMDALEEQLVVLENTKRKPIAKMEELLGEQVVDIEAILSPDSLATLDFNFIELENKLAANHPLVERLQLQLEASKQKQEAIRKEGAPAIGLGVDYSVVAPRTDADPAGNGQDILVPKVMLSVPLYRKGFKAKNEEEQLMQQAIVSRQEAVVNMLLRKAVEHKVDYDNALLNYALLHKQLATAKQVYALLLTDYSVSGVAFSDVLEVQDLQYALELKLVEVRLQSYLAVTDIERISDF